MQKMSAKELRLLNKTVKMLRKVIHRWLESDYTLGSRGKSNFLFDLLEESNNDLSLLQETLDFKTVKKNRTKSWKKFTRPEGNPFSGSNPF